MKTLLQGRSLPADNRQLLSLARRCFNLAKQRHNLLLTEPLLWAPQSSFPSQFPPKRLVQKSEAKSGGLNGVFH